MSSYVLTLVVVASGEPVPKGKSAIGWRIGVYWKDDQKFYQGEVESYENATGRHMVLYDDGEDSCRLILLWCQGV